MPQTTGSSVSTEHSCSSHRDVLLIAWLVGSACRCTNHSWQATKITAIVAVTVTMMKRSQSESGHAADGACCLITSRHGRSSCS
eukprot:3802436-Rhodomonas_salina.1